MRVHALVIVLLTAVGEQLMLKSGPLVTVTAAVTVAPFASLTVIVAEPGATPVTVNVNGAVVTVAGETVAIVVLLEKTEYGAVPPKIVNV